MFSNVMNRLGERRAADLEGEEVDAGFTLIELMVVLLILAILLAIAIPTFLGVTNSANDRASQSNLNTALTDGKSIYESNQQAYPTSASLISSLGTNEPSLKGLLVAPTAGTALTAGQIAVYVSSDSNGVVYLTLAKKTNICWFLADNTGVVNDTGANTPYGATGVPTSAGEQYGAYNSSGPNGTACEMDKVLGAKGISKSTTQFPSAPPVVP